MRDVSEAMKQFYQPLVGSDLQVTDLKRDLAEHVNDYPGEIFDAIDPYSRLQQALINRIDGAAWGIRGLASIDKMNTYNNGATAMTRTVSVARTVGEIYQAKTKVPQDVSRIRRSTNQALLGLYGIAHSDRGIAGVNLTAFQSGKNPKTALAKFIARIWLYTNALEMTTEVNPRSLKATEDGARQIDIKPRYKLWTPGQTGHKCPATSTRVEIGGRSRPALWILMEAVGDVAISEIYPHYFDITYGSEELASPAAVGE